MTDSLSTLHGGNDPELEPNPEAQHALAEVVHMHDLLLDSIFSGKLPVPSISTYGVNEEFATVVIHATARFVHGKRRIFKRWLKQGLIYPRVYATCFEWYSKEQGRRFPYGVFSHDMEPGYQRRRAAIGMGDDRLDGLRFHWGARSTDH